MPEKTLIITSWSRDYACAASMALIQFPDAELRVASQSYLPRLFEKLGEGKKREQPGRILILGVNLGYDPERLAAAMDDVDAAVIWISVYRMAANAVELMESRLTPCVAPGQSLCDAVRSVLEIPVPADGLEAVLAGAEGDSRALRVMRIADDQYTADADLLWRQVIAAAAARFRRRRVLDDYVNVIRDILVGEIRQEHHDLEREYQLSGDQELIGASDWLKETRLKAVQIAESNLHPILILGEPGTGKEVLARHIHDCSDRLGGPFEVISCPGLTDEQCDRLFVGETGPGKAFQRAAGGTLVLDGIDELSPHGQAVLTPYLVPGRLPAATVLENDKSPSGPPRIIGIAGRDPARLVDESLFRADLYWRLSMVVFRCPPLRERPADITALTNHFLYISRQPRLTDEEIEALQAYEWPGNAWQIKAVIDRIIALRDRDFQAQLGQEAAKHIGAADTVPNDAYVLLPTGSLEVEAVTRAHMKRVFEMCDQNYTKTAKVLGLGSVNTLKKHLGDYAT